MFRSSLLFLVISFYVNGSAQDLIYSEPVGNYPYSNSAVIGSVKNNIAVYNRPWSRDLDVRKSEILIYNDKMQLLHKTSFKSLTPKFSSVDFITQENSFSAVLQYEEDSVFVCKLINFDADGNVSG